MLLSQCRHSRKNRGARIWKFCRKIHPGSVKKLGEDLEDQYKAAGGAISQLKRRSGCISENGGKNGYCGNIN